METKGVNSVERDTTNRADAAGGETGDAAQPKIEQLRDRAGVLAKLGPDQIRAAPAVATAPAPTSYAGAPGADAYPLGGSAARASLAEEESLADEAEAATTGTPTTGVRGGASSS
jgi:hypothetical protein